MFIFVNCYGWRKSIVRDFRTLTIGHLARSSLIVSLSHKILSLSFRAIVARLVECESESENKDARDKKTNKKLPRGNNARASTCSFPVCGTPSTCNHVLLRLLSGSLAVWQSCTVSPYFIATKAYGVLCVQESLEKKV